MLIKISIFILLMFLTAPSMAIEYWMYEVVSAKTQFEPTSKRIYELAPLDRLYGHGEANMENVSYIETEIVAHDEIQQGSWILMAIYPSGRKFVMDVTQPHKGLVNNNSIRTMMFDIIEDTFEAQLKVHPASFSKSIKVNMTLSKHIIPTIELDHSEGDNIHMMLVDFYLKKLMAPVSEYFEISVSVRFEIAFREDDVNIRLYNRSDRFFSVREMYDPFQSLSPKFTELLLN